MLNKRLGFLRKEKGLTQYKVAEILGISRGKLANYEQGSRQPDYDMLIQLASFYNVTTDYLLGETDNPNVHNDKFNPMDEINKLIEEYKIEHSGFYDIEKWRAMGPEEIKQLEEYFEFITSRAKKKNDDPDNR